MVERDENGRLKKGHSGLRKKGSKNEKTKAWEALKEMFIGDYTDNIKDYLADLYEKDPDKFFAAYCQLLEYFKPKHSRTDITSNGKDIGATVTIEVKDQKTAEKLKNLK